MSVILAVALIGCDSPNNSETDTSKMVAATVNGVEIFEDTITNKIMASRNSNESYQDDAAWATALSYASYTPTSLREETIRAEAALIVLQEIAVEYEVSPNSEYVDQEIAQAKESLGAVDDETWLSTLEQYGYTSEEDLRTQIEASNLHEQLVEVLAEAPSEEDIQAFVLEQAPYCAGKRSSVIVLSPSEDRTQEDRDALAAQIKQELDGGADFKAMVEQYSEDDTTKQNGGDCGWNVFGMLDMSCNEALEEMALDEIRVVNSEVGATFIIKCTDIFEIPEGEQLDYKNVPEDIAAMLREEHNSGSASTAFENMFEERYEQADVDIKPMPEGLPYDVDMSLAEATDPSNEGAMENPGMPDYSASDPEAVQAAIDAGLIIEDVVVGNGDEAVPGSKVNVKYSLYLEDGKLLQESEFAFVLGRDSIIPGWHAGVVGMKVGGKRNLTIPPSYGYGAQGNGDVPPNATLFFEIELLGVELIDLAPTEDETEDFSEIVVVPEDSEEALPED
jgi:foldase protein PrsA